VLAVEVALRSTRKLDRTTKKREYAAFGIDHYWIVVPDRDRPSITAFRRNGKKYEQVALVAGSETFHAAEPFAVGIVPALLAADGKAWRSLLH
jgi:Uma2 family endonuclease